MSERREKQNQKDVNAEQSDDVNSDKDQGRIKVSKKNSGCEAETEVNTKMADGETTEQEEEHEGEEASLELTEDEIAELKKKAEERDSFLDQLLRVKAEFVNYQKRMLKENEATAQFAVQNLILDFLPELDNFDRALKLADSSQDINKFVEGIKLIEEQLFKVLGKYGVASIETVGKPFDPNLHEAVMEEENNEMPHHTIIDEFQRGFLLNERVIRPSKVKVSKRTVEEGKTEKKEEDQDDEQCQQQEKEKS